MSGWTGGDGKYKPGPTPAAKVYARLGLSGRVIREDLCHRRRILAHDLHEHDVLLVWKAMLTGAS